MVSYLHCIMNFKNIGMMLDRLLTGLAQISGRNLLSWKERLKKILAM